MTIKDLKDVLKEFNNPEYDDFEIEFWDYKNQQPVVCHKSHGVNKDEKRITFPVDVPYEEIDLIIPEEKILRNR